MNCNSVVAFLIGAVLGIAAIWMLVQIWRAGMWAGR